MSQLGFALSSEEHSPIDLVNQARRAEEVGFSFALISDHYHPWVSRQGHAPFVWSVIGGIAQATKTLQLGTGVTCPTVRIHPAVIAQAAATAASMMPGRFFLGVGTGENLNEHITGEKWQPYDIRLAMLEEAVEVIRTLWEGGAQSFWGSFYTVEDACIYTLPDELPPIMVAASGPKAATAAGRMGDGLISTAPDTEVMQAFETAGGEGPRFGQMTVCWAASDAEARRTAFEIWPNAGLTGQLSQEIRTVTHFEQACKMLNEESATKELACGPDAAQYIEKIQKFADAGYDHVYLHQIGPDQEGFFRFCEREILPHFK